MPHAVRFSHRDWSSRPRVTTALGQAPVRSEMMGIQDKCLGGEETFQPRFNPVTLQ